MTSSLSLLACAKHFVSRAGDCNDTGRAVFRGFPQAFPDSTNSRRIQSIPLLRLVDRNTRDPMLKGEKHFSVHLRVPSPW